MPALVLVLGLLIATAALYELARRLSVPYPTVLVLGGVVPGGGARPAERRARARPRPVRLPAAAAVRRGVRDAPARPPREHRPAVPPRGRPGAVHGRRGRGRDPGDRPRPRLAGGVRDGRDRRPHRRPRSDRRLPASSASRGIVTTLVDGESLFNDATALVVYRAAVAVAIGGVFLPGAGGADVRARRRRRHRHRLARGPRRVCRAAAARRPAGRGRDLAGHPVPRVPARRPARDRRACSRR